MQTYDSSIGRHYSLEGSTVGNTGATKFTLGSGGSIVWDGGPNILNTNSSISLSHDATGVLALVNSTNPQTLRVYNTKVGTTGAAEYATINWSGGILNFGTFALNGGNAASLQIITNNVPRIIIDSVGAVIITGTTSIPTLTLNTDLSVSDGGTAASTAAGARANLGVNKKTIQFAPYALNDPVITGSGVSYFRVPPSLSGGDITWADAYVNSTGITNVGIMLTRTRAGNTVNVLSSSLIIDSGEYGTDTSSIPYSINTSNDDLITFDLLKLNVTGAPTGIGACTGLLVSFEVTL